MDGIIAVAKAVEEGMLALQKSGGASALLLIRKGDSHEKVFN